MEQHMDFEKKQKAAARRGRIGKFFTYFFLSVWALIVLFPFYWMLLTSVKSYGAYNAEHVPAFFTLSPTLQNYKDAFTTVPLLGYLINTVIFTLATTILMVVVSTLAAYAFARLRFKGKDLLFTLFLSLMMIPNELVVITNFVTITNMDLRNTFTGLILPSVTSVFYIYLLKENFEQVPDELYKAAKVDGTSDLKYLLKVMVPICRPNFVTITNMDLRNTFTGLILPSVTSVFYIYLLKENFEQVPDELYKAAKVDGTSDLKYLLKVMVPICRPIIVTITILKVIECWNSYVWPRLITDDPAYFLVSNGIQEIRENGFGRENIPAMMAAVVVISVPLIVLFLIFRRKIMEGVSRGGMKG